jgi:uncharacterized membrane-anchored protein
MNCRRALACVALLAASMLATAADQSGASPSAAQAEMESAVTQANAVTKHGPDRIVVKDQAVLNLPAQFGFIPAAESARLLKAMGNRPGDDLLGIITPEQEGAEWFMVVRYVAAGYIRDEDAKDWNADDLLKSIREGTEETNAERRNRKLPELEVLGWVQAPQYEAATHRLVWSLSSREKGATSDADNGVNYNTLVLGREGYVSMNMVAGARAIEALKPTAHGLLASLDFADGKRYADFNSSTDKVAEYGLAALVAGVAAKKLGLLAVIAAFVVKFAKVIGIAAIAGLGGFAKWFGGRKKPADSA